MKKLALVLVALMTMFFTGCKTERSTVTVHVEDTAGVPIANRYVFYADWASIIIDAALPSPEELATNVSDCWDVAQTNNYGEVVIPIKLSVAKLKYRFMVYDDGIHDWVAKDVTLRRGVNDEISFVVNK